MCVFACASEELPALFELRVSPVQILFGCFHSILSTLNFCLAWDPGVRGGVHSSVARGGGSQLDLAVYLCLCKIRTAPGVFYLDGVAPRKQQLVIKRKNREFAKGVLDQRGLGLHLQNMHCLRLYMLNPPWLDTPLRIPDKPHSHAVQIVVTLAAGLKGS